VLKQTGCHLAVHKKCLPKIKVTCALLPKKDKQRSGSVGSSKVGSSSSRDRLPLEIVPLDVRKVSSSFCSSHPCLLIHVQPNLRSLIHFLDVELNALICRLQQHKHKDFESTTHQTIQSSQDEKKGSKTEESSRPASVTQVCTHNSFRLFIASHLVPQSWQRLTT